MAENVEDILDLHANESEEDSFENTLSESNDLSLLFGGICPISCFSGSK
jgi:hypothetical protein